MRRIRPTDTERLRVELELAESEADRLRALGEEMAGALEDIASLPCCQTPGCSEDDPACDSMKSRATLAKWYGREGTGI